MPSLATTNLSMGAHALGPAPLRRVDRVVVRESERLQMDALKMEERLE